MKKFKSLAAFFFFLLASSAIAFAAQAVPANPVPGMPILLTYVIDGNGSFNPDRIQTLTVNLVDKDGKAAPSGFDLQGFDARMPEHQHGMATKAVIQKKSNAEYTVSGVKLHMPGKWVLEFKVSDKVSKVSSVVSVKVSVEIK